MEIIKNATAIIYARQSYGKEENSLSIENQINQCVSWAKRNKVTVVGIYKDNNTSSELYPDNAEGRAYCMIDKYWQEWANTTGINKQKRLNRKKVYRKGLAEAFDNLRNIDYFIVNERTRFFRNPGMAQLDDFCLLKLKEMGTKLVEVESNKIDSIDNNMDLMIEKLLATYEMQKLEEKRIQSIRSRQMNILRGQVFSSAFGVIWKDKKIYFDERKCEAVKYIFDAIIAGKTHGEIMYTLNKEYKDCCNGKSFYTSNIYDAIKNPVYAGYKLYDSEYIKIQNLGNPPIISFTKYKKAKEILDANKMKTGKAKFDLGEGRKRHFLPLSGMLFCGACMAKMVVWLYNGITYKCNAIVNKNGTPYCEHFRVFNDSKKNPYDFLRNIQPLFLIHIYQFLNSLREKDKKAELKELYKERDYIKGNIDNIFDLQDKRKIDPALFNDKIIEMNNKMSEIKEKILVLENYKSEEDEKLAKEYTELIPAIAKGQPIDNDIYGRLLRQTIKWIVVESDHIDITLTDGNTFSLPRVMKKYRQKKVYACFRVSSALTVNTCHEFTFGRHRGTKKEVLLDTPNYKIIYQD